MSLQKIRRRRFGDILISEGILNPDQIQAALQHQAATGEPIGRTLLNQGLITEGDVVRTICVQFSLPFISPATYELNTALLERVPVEFMYQHRLMPLDQIGSTVIVALGEIPSEESESELKQCLDADLAFYFSSAKEIENYLVTSFSMTQDQIYALDSSRRAPQPLSAAAPGVQQQQNLLEALDSSWEAIFDEAENSIQETP